MTRPHQPEPEVPNVLRLYEELGVHPEEGLPRLTERYRQRLRALHPDRGGEPGGELGWITRSYRDAVAFERRHGRLPGAALGGAQGVPPAGKRASAVAPRRAPLRRGGGGRWRWLLAGVALGALLVAVAGELRHRLSLEARPMEAIATLRVGSTTDEVLRIQGPPYERRGQRWHYGQSWIEFRDGRVVGWHSARNRPLQVDEPDRAPPGGG